MELLQDHSQAWSQMMDISRCCYAHTLLTIWMHQQLNHSLLDIRH